MLRGRWIFAAGGAAVIAIVMIAWRVTREQPATPPPTAKPAPTKRVERMAVDVAKYKAMRQVLIDRAKALAARRPAPPPERQVPEKDAKGRPAVSSLVSPMCKVGPAELCETIANIAADCDALDGQACLAVGQLLADTPPRSMLARVFFARACEAGEQEACARVKLLDGPEPVACETDVFACGWRAWKAQDPVALEEACAYGVSEACIQLVPLRDGDPVKGRAYLEHGCQLGDPNACEGLGFMLSAACDDPACFPPDPEQSKAAYAIACAAGWESACNK
ncbi:MAG: hypothetical protein SFX73_04050 [Kofleriaceae bacterium]|nr:hypothetical protein [Kofleriaceae bacterium]